MKGPRRARVTYAGPLTLRDGGGREGGGGRDGREPRVKLVGTPPSTADVAD